MRILKRVLVASFKAPFSLLQYHYFSKNPVLLFNPYIIYLITICAKKHCDAFLATCGPVPPTKDYAACTFTIRWLEMQPAPLFCVRIYLCCGRWLIAQSCIPLVQCHQTLLLLCIHAHAGTVGVCVTAFIVQILWSLHWPCSQYTESVILRLYIYIYIQYNWQTAVSHFLSTLLIQTSRSTSPVVSRNNHHS